MDPANRNVTGVAVAESTTWTIDRNRDVFVYGESGEVLGRWRPSDVRRPEGIATDGTHLWIVDRTTDRVYFYANGAQLRSGDVTATTSFELNEANGQAFGITVGLENGQQKLWVVDDRGSTEQVFRYRLDGVLEGRWEFDTDENSQPRGGLPSTAHPPATCGSWTVVPIGSRGLTRRPPRRLGLKQETSVLPWRRQPPILRGWRFPHPHRPSNPTPPSLGNQQVPLVPPMATRLMRRSGSGCDSQGHSAQRPSRCPSSTGMPCKMGRRNN